jgi:fatty-acyl-CoA synthase
MTCTVAEIPHTATGKVQKMALREQFRDYVLPRTTAPVPRT